jgi:hypothetical protein
MLLNAPHAVFVIYHDKSVAFETMSVKPGSVDDVGVGATLEGKYLLVSSRIAPHKAKPVKAINPRVRAEVPLLVVPVPPSIRLVPFWVDISASSRLDREMSRDSGGKFVVARWRRSGESDRER